MALHYQTECRVGTRRINRSYNGFQAFVAIVFDLVFGLVFELVSAVFRLAVWLVSVVLELGVEGLTRGGKALLTAISMAVYVLTYPFMLLHEAVVRFGWAHRYSRQDDQPASARKPDWAVGREL